MSTYFDGNDSGNALMNLRSTVLATLLLFVSATAAEAGLIIKGVDTTIQQGGTGFVDFTIESDGPVFDFLAFYNAQFQIAPTGSTRLEFAPTTIPPFNTPDYVMNVVGINQGITVGPTTSVVPNDTITVGDATGSNPPVAILPSSTKLLARLQLTTLGPLAPQAGDAFVISMNPFPPTGFAPPLADFSQSDLTARVEVVASSNVIPEPASAVIWALPGVVSVFGRRRRR
ncbi:hypothetical protein [Stieleria mannarensis]|uniref:hypothetical protein n=1 Tax=Stieleria mannarensis TaxID=2755585 RepID=UPI00160146F3|nr:hypothetical protein [Rhodopirellula sp. JC639]